MRITCDQLKEIVSSFSLVEQCDIVRNGMLRIATPFTYPNGSQIDIFLRSNKTLFGGEYILSDYGQTADYLTDLQIKPWATKKRRRLIEDVCESLGIKQQGGVFEASILLENTDKIPQVMVRLAQACIRVADLMYTQKLQTAGTFQEEVEEYLSLTTLQYEPEVSLTGAYGKEVKVDFRVIGDRVVSLVQTISTANPSNAHALSLEVFRRWYDLTPHQAMHQFVTLYDSTSKVFREDDLERLASKSVVLGFPQDREQFREAVAA